MEAYNAVAGRKPFTVRWPHAPRVVLSAMFQKPINRPFFGVAYEYPIGCDRGLWHAYRFCLKRNFRSISAVSSASQLSVFDKRRSGPRRSTSGLSFNAARTLSAENLPSVAGIQ